MNNNLQEVKGKTKLKFSKNISKYYENMNSRMDGDPFARNGQGLSKIYHEVLLLMKFIQSKPQVKNMNNNCYDLYYTVIKNGDRKEIVDNQYENDSISFNDIVPNQYTERKNNIEALRYREI